jgi:hypothetical protein
MTMLDTFLSFARSLPADRLQSVELALATIMETYSDRHPFSDAEITELDRRVREPSPRFANATEVTALFGKPFSE